MENLLDTDACAMPTGDRPARMAEFDALFASALLRVEQRGSDILMHLAGQDGLVERVRDLTDREKSCCSFFTFSIEGSDHELTLAVSVPSGRREMLDAIAERARELSA